MHTCKPRKTARANKNEVGFSYDKTKLPECMAREKNNKLDQNPNMFGMVCYGRTLGLGECAPPTIVAVAVGVFSVHFCRQLLKERQLLTRSKLRYPKVNIRISQVNEKNCGWADCGQR